jgi:hypothetical protein
MGGGLNTTKRKKIKFAPTLEGEFLRNIQKMPFPLKLNRTPNWTISKCSSRAFQRMVISVGFENRKFRKFRKFGQFLCSAYRSIPCIGASRRNLTHPLNDRGTLQHKE